MTEKCPISLVVITLNEEENLARCLQSADFCAEQIVVDSGSTDGTLEIAARFGARVFRRKWTGYGDQKNFGADQATQPWVLCLDADEEVSPELRGSIVETFSRDVSVDGFEINRHSLYAGKLINHGGWYPQWRLFLYRKGKAVWGGEEPHTEVVFHGRGEVRLQGDLYHHTYSGIQRHIEKNLASAHAAARAMHRRGRRASAWDLVIRPPWAVVRAYVLQLGLLDGFHGLVIAAGSGFYTFAKYAALWELHRKDRR